MSADVPENGGLSVSPDWVGDPAAVGDLLRGLGFREDVVEALAEAARELAGRPEELHGIIGFGRMFFPLILPDADDAQLVERVLDTPPGRETSLQRKIHSHRAAGGRFRLTSGFLLPEILEKPGA